MHRTLHLHSLNLVIASETLELDALLDGLYLDNELSPQSELTLRIELGEPDGIPAVADRPDAAFAETNLCGGRCYFDAGRFGARLGGEYPLMVDYDVSSARLDAVLGGRFGEEPQAIVGRVLRPVLQSFLLPFHGLKSLHGAVVARRGRGVFLAGAGGAGKTTTAVALARSGWTLVSDDGPLFAPADDGPVALSSLDYAHLTERTLDLFPELRAQTVGGRDHREKYMVPLAAFEDDGSRRGPVPIDHFVLLRRAPVDEPRLVPVERAHVLRDLVAEEMVVFRTPRLRTPPFIAYSRWCLDIIAGVVARSTPTILEFDDHHLDDVPTLIEALVQRG